MHTRRILLTGAGGFVGGAILRHLVDQGHEVVALSGRQGLPAAETSVEWRFLDLLASDERDVEKIVRASGVSHCIHAAWYTSHADYLTSGANREWLAASLRLAEGFHAGGGRRFLGLGTCLEYDQEAAAGPFTEDVTPLRPNTLYARSKLETFERLSEAAAAADRDFAWARLFFIYGPGDRAQRLVPYLLGNLSQGHPVAARFGGVYRDYIHVDDLAVQLTKILLGAVGGAINCGTGRAVKLADIFRIAAELAGRTDLIELNDRTGEERLRIEADMSKFRTLVGRVEARSLRDGLQSLLAASH